jgi:hypothetical protein
MGSRREHEGRTPQPGVPSGPRNTPKRKAKKAPVKVSVPYAPTKKGKEAEEEDRGPVTVPYAPTPTGKAAEKKAVRKQERKAIRKALRDAPISPSTSYQRAKFRGEAPSAELRDKYPRAYESALKEFGDYHAEHDAVKEDPLAEFVISTAATAGLGTGAKLAGAAGKAGLARIASLETSVGESAAEKGLKAVAKKAASKVKAAPARKAARVKTAPKRAARRIKETPQRVKTAPARAKKAASTKEGRRAAAKGAGKTAVRHPIKTGVPAAAAVPPGVLPAEVDVGDRARGFFEGSAAAILGHPGKTLETTGHGVLGFLTSPVALAGAGLSSAKEGSPDPLVDEASTLYEGTKKMVSGLASGDPRKVERTTLQETGLTPFLPVPHIAKRLKGSTLYEDSIRGKVRETVEGKRAKTRAKRIEAERTATEGGQFVGRKKAKKIRQSVEDTARPGERYVARRTGKFIEKQRSRHHVAREVTRMQEEGEFSSKKVSESVAKALRKSKLSNQKEQNIGEALRIFVKHGLPADEAAGMALVKRLHDSYSKVEHGDIPAGVHLDRHSTQFILDHPEVFRDKHFWEAVKRFDAQAERVGTSERNRYLASANNLVNPIRRDEGKLPVLKPEERVPKEALPYLPKRKDRWSRAEALSYLDDLRKVDGPEQGEALAKAQKLSLALDGLMRPPEHGGAKGGVSTTHAEAWTSEMEKDFVKEMAAEHARLGLRKPAAYVADIVPSGLKGEDKAPNFAAELPLRKVWPSQGKAAMSGNAESSFESLMHGSAEAPRARQATVAGLNRIFDRASRKVEGKRYLTRDQAEHAINTHQVPEGTIFVRTQALKSLLEGEHHVDPATFHRELMAEIEHGQKLAAKDELGGEMEAMKASGVKGEKFAPMDAAAIHELMGHMEPLGRATRYAAHATNFATRTILNSPAFAAIQIPQEGLPLAAALGRNVVDLPKAIVSLHQISKLDPELQAQIKATVGSSAGVLGAPSTKALRSEGYMNPIRAAGSYPKWRRVWDLINGNVIGKFDRSRAGLFRETAAMAKINGDLRRASKGFNVWRSSANNLFKHEQEAIQAMKGMNSAERAAYVAEHPRLGDKLMKDLNGMAGNFNSFTVFEKHLAPFTIFYPFQRYSVLWMLYHFPLDHPVVATGLTLLGQVNAQELQKIAATKGATPDIIDYTMPVIQNGEGEEATVLPAGQRTFPGLSTVQSAAVTDNPSQLLGELSPALQIGVSAAAGVDSFTGQPLGENGWEYAARSALALSPLARFLGLPATGQEQSVASKAYEEQDPLKKYRSGVNPFIGQTGKQYAATKALSKAFDEKYSDPVPSIFDNPKIGEALYGPDGKVDWDLVKQLMQEHKKAEAGSDKVKKAEQKFFDESGGDFSDEQSKALGMLQGGLLVPLPEESAEDKLNKQLGLPSMPSKAELDKQLGIPAAPSAAELDKLLGIR